MEIPKLKIGTMTADVPIVQGAMGVRVSLASLAAAVANEGGIGTIASVGLGDLEASEKFYVEQSNEALALEIKRAQAMTDGHIGVNVMGALSNGDDLIKTAVAEGIKLIVCGAGLPLMLPQVVSDDSVNLAVIVSSGRATELILRTWDRRFKKTADAVILEGPLAGGHLGFSEAQLADPDTTVESILPDVLAAVERYEDKYGTKIPVIVGGGIFDGADIASVLRLGASGVQMGTRFVCTDECDVSQTFKQVYLDAKEEDVIIVKSPVGMPGRAIRNKFLIDIEAHGGERVRCPYRCLSSCKAGDARFCIAKALLNASDGNVESGLIFSGKNSYRINSIVSVKELMAELCEGIVQA